MNCHFGQLYEMMYDRAWSIWPIQPWGEWWYTAYEPIADEM